MRSFLAGTPAPEHTISSPTLIAPAGTAPEQQIDNFHFSLHNTCSKLTTPTMSLLQPPTPRAVFVWLLCTYQERFDLDVGPKFLTPSKYTSTLITFTKLCIWEWDGIGGLLLIRFKTFNLI